MEAAALVTQTIRIQLAVSSAESLSWAATAR